MSLPPVQAPTPDYPQKSKAVTPADPVDPRQDKGFKGSFDQAAANQDAKAADESDGQRGEQAAKKIADPANHAASTGEKAPAIDPETGKALPPEMLVGDEVVTAINPQLVAQEPLVLNLETQTLQPENTDEALLLAASFVVESLPKTARNATADVQLTATAGKPEVLARLQSLTGQMTLPLAPTRQTADGAARELQQLDANLFKKLTDVAASTSPGQSNDSAESITQLQAQEARQQAATLTAKTELVVPNRVGSTDWGEAMAGRITLMVNQKISSARIHINPPELGPIEVRVNLNNEQASVQFTSQSPQVRDALEQSIPRLREMLETAGFSLADSGVNDQPGEGSGRGDDKGNGGGSGPADETVQVSHRETVGLVDDYA